VSAAGSLQQRRHSLEVVKTDQMPFSQRGHVSNVRRRACSNAAVYSPAAPVIEQSTWSANRGAALSIREADLATMR
jgi:hypothetical protein